MVDEKKKIAGTVFVGIVIFLVGLVAYQALTPNYLTEEEIEVAREKCLEKKNYYFSYTSNQEGNVLATTCKFNYNIGESRVEDTEIKIDRYNSIEHRLLDQVIENQQIIIEFLKNQTGD